MDFRKLIKFGNSSFVISLPKAWVEKNGLKKGDVVSVEQSGKNELLVLPKSRPNRELTETTINIDDLSGTEGVRTLIISAYMKDYDIINIVGKDLVKKSKDIRDYFQELASIEIVEQSPKKIVARCFLDPSNLSVPSLLRRMDVMTHSMLNDAELSIVSENMGEYVYQKEEDVTRLSFMIFKVLRRALVEPELASKINLDHSAILQMWCVTNELENIADQAKRICRHLGKEGAKKPKELEELFKKIIELYAATMKVYHTSDQASAVKVLQSRDRIMDDSKYYLEVHMDPITVSIVEKVRRIVVHLANIAKIVVDA